MRHETHEYDAGTGKAELRTRLVMLLTGAMMVAEIFAGSVYGSIALLADGWHMSTHMAAFLIAVVAYAVARRQRRNPRFSFGTGKVGVLGGFASSILLLVVAAVMGYESALRLLNPTSIQFGQALLVAVIGLVVNVVCAVILNGAQESAGGHSPGHSHSHGQDKNLKAAYIHVVADAFTSVTAIFALVMGMLFGIVWIDAVMGFVGSFMIILWAIGILKETTPVLVDYFPKDSDLEDEIRRAFGALPHTKIADLHLWQVASGRFAAIVSVDAEEPMPVEAYHRLVDMHEELVHVTIQVLGPEAK